MYKIIGADGREYGPIPADQLRQWIAEGRANSATRVLPEGGATWLTLGSMPEFAPYIRPVYPSYLPGPAARTHPLAITCFIFGILALMFGWCCCYGLPFIIPGVIFGLIALNEINKSPQTYQGRGFVVAGLVLCAVSVVLVVFFFAKLGASSHEWSGLPKRHRL